MSNRGAPRKPVPGPGRRRRGQRKSRVPAPTWPTVAGSSQRRLWKLSGCVPATLGAGICTGPGAQLCRRVSLGLHPAPGAGPPRCSSLAPGEPPVPTPDDVRGGGAGPVVKTPPPPPGSLLLSGGVFPVRHSKGFLEASPPLVWAGFWSSRKGHPRPRFPGEPAQALRF